MRVFVLNTGRCGSTTLTKACEHIENYTCGHETKINLYGNDRLNFKDQHIESDNRLSWFLGTLDKQYGKDAFYVHLYGDSEKVAVSYNKRWGWTGSIMDAFGYGILLREISSKVGRLWNDQERLEVTRYYVQTVTDNITAFLKDKPNKINLSLENIYDDFPMFWDAIGAKGDLKMALKEWDKCYNKTPELKEDH